MIIGILKEKQKYESRVSAMPETIKKLIKRIKENEITEVILALSTTMEGQTTTHVIADKLETFKNLTVTRLAQGIPIGGEVHYLDENTLNTAFQSRKKII